ncbi:hypothetical protein [Bacillus cereus]|uniref:Large polyvalent protein associated domain-containing protein n=1 Tax=Bacillus cereus TaxID=1396 RepID=A0A164NYT2_BACCE|nr:hypothetical protein [Bacillus cereus]KZD66005.1 hypothetical protein B4088_2762 [Bacillus cereus]
MRPINDVVELSKQLRKKLREVLGKDAVKKHKISVTSDRYSMGSSINVSAIDMSKDYLEILSREFEQVRRDSVTGDVLSGGNTYLLIRVEYTDEFKELFHDVLDEHILNDYQTKQSYSGRYIAEREKFAKKLFENDNPEIDLSLLEPENGNTTQEQNITEPAHPEPTIEEQESTTDDPEPLLHIHGNVIDATALFQRNRTVKEF